MTLLEPWVFLWGHPKPANLPCISKKSILFYFFMQLLKSKNILSVFSGVIKPVLCEEHAVSSRVCSTWTYSSLKPIMSTESCILGKTSHPLNYQESAFGSGVNFYTLKGRTVQKTYESIVNSFEFRDASSEVSPRIVTAHSWPGMTTSNGTRGLSWRASMKQPDLTFDEMELFRVEEGMFLFIDAEGLYAQNAKHSSKT